MPFGNPFRERALNRSAGDQSLPSSCQAADAAFDGAQKNSHREREAFRSLTVVEQTFHKMQALGRNVQASKRSPARPDLLRYAYC